MKPDNKQDGKPDKETLEEIKKNLWSGAYTWSPFGYGEWENPERNADRDIEFLLGQVAAAQAKGEAIGGRRGVAETLEILQELINDHYWDSLDSEREIIKRHWSFISGEAQRLSRLKAKAEGEKSPEDPDYLIRKHKEAQCSCNWGEVEGLCAEAFKAKAEGGSE